jgi:hypothetical protein
MLFLKHLSDEVWQKMRAELRRKDFANPKDMLELVKEPLEDKTSCGEAIPHNINRFTIENGDTLEDSQILDSGQVRKF